MVFDTRGFAAWLVPMMRDVGITSQADLARRLGMSEATVSRWLSGAAIPGYDDIAELARVLGVDRGVIYEAAGVIPVRDAEQLADLLSVWETLSEDERQTLSDLGRVMVRRRLAAIQAELEEDDAK
jgi:transcriptional regulator with XRE-family HTH domain